MVPEDIRSKNVILFVTECLKLGINELKNSPWLTPSWMEEDWRHLCLDNHQNIFRTYIFYVVSHKISHVNPSRRLTNNETRYIKNSYMRELVVPVHSAFIGLPTTENTADRRFPTNLILKNQCADFHIFYHYTILIHAFFQPCWWLKIYNNLFFNWEY